MNSSLNNPHIRSIAVAVPDHRISQEKHYSILQTANGLNREEQLRLRKIYSHSGIKYRHSVLNEFADHDKSENAVFHPSGDFPVTMISERMRLYETFAIDLCEEAVLNCLNQDNSIKKEEITHLITFSCTGMSAPGIDIQLVNKIGLNRNVERTCINFMGCYAGVNALKTAYHISRSQPDSVILLAGVELCTLHYQKNHEQDQMVANALFADGAAAAIVTSRKNDNCDKVNLSLENFYSEFEPSGSEDMTWRIGDNGFDLRLSSYVPSLVKDNIAGLTEKLFQHSKIKKEEIDFYAIHPGGLKILEACEKALDITKEQNSNSYKVLEEYGNMSSVTIFFVLKAYLNQLTAADKGKNIFACAFGPGLTMESMILKVQ